MTTVAERLVAIEEAPEGHATVAVFDFDGTILSGFSAASFYRDRMRRRQLGPIEIARTALAARNGIRTPEDFGAFLDIAVGAWRGRTIEELEAIGRRLARSEIGGRIRPEVWTLLEAHRAAGHLVVVASSATSFQVEPLANELGADHVLSTQVEVGDDGVLTGRIEGLALWGAEKPRAVRRLLTEEGVAPETTFGYADGDEDVELLGWVDRPVAVEPRSGLREAAGELGWPVLDCEPREGRPALADVARTVGFYSTMAGAFGGGIGLGLLNRSRRTVVDITASVGAELGLAVAGVDVDVVSGAEHLWSARPCVFIFNHQSNLDTIVVMRLIREHFTGVAKAEARDMPGFGLFFRIAGVAFVERGDTAQAREALAGPIAKVREEGYSLAISPEGTRSVTPRIGPFKKGAFHIARQAGVPIVPIVLRGAGEAMWRASRVIRPRAVEVAVLPPVPTTDWTHDDVGDKRDEIRDAMVATLARWPGDLPALEG